MNEEKHDNHRSKHETNFKSQKQSKIKFPWRNTTTRMEEFAYICAAAAGILALLMGLAFSLNHRDWGLWLTCASFCFAVVAGFAWKQDRLWKADSDQVEAAKTVISTKRAHMIVESVVASPAVPEAGKQYSVTLTLKNIGETTAKRCRLSSVIDPVPKGEAPNFIYQESEVLDIGFLAPGVPYTTEWRPVFRKSTGKEAPLNAELIRAMESRDIQLFVHGRLDYSDVAGQPHWVTWCYLQQVPFNGLFGVSKMHNDSDD